MKKATTTTTPTGLAARWVPVQTPDGRTRMEMRWTAPSVIRRHTAA
jgi:hypothetical protein